MQVPASNWTRAGRTCPPAMGFSFAAGTTDGPGAFDFTQGDTTGSPLWFLVRDALQPPSPETQACHAPKPILLDTGHLNVPYPWQPHVVDLSVARIGALVIVAVPGEFTTMAGRRMCAAVAQVIGDAFGPGLKVRMRACVRIDTAVHCHAWTLDSADCMQQRWCNMVGHRSNANLLPAGCAVRTEWNGMAHPLYIVHTA